MPGYLKTLVDALTDAGLELPVPVARCIAGQPTPLALDTRERLADWCKSHGYDDAQRRRLQRIVGIVVTRPAYFRMVADGQARRMDVDGVEAGPISDRERQHAAARLVALEAALRDKAAAQAAPVAVEGVDPLPAAPAVLFASLSTAARPAPTSPAVAVLLTRSTSAPRRSWVAPPVRPERQLRPLSPSRLPAAVIGDAVERIAQRRHSRALISAYLRGGRHDAVVAERSAWTSDAVAALVADGHPRDAAELQVAIAIADRLVTLVPPSVRRSGAWP